MNLKKKTVVALSALMLVGSMPFNVMAKPIDNQIVNIENIRLEQAKTGRVATVIKDLDGNSILEINISIINSKLYAPFLKIIELKELDVLPNGTVNIKLNTNDKEVIKKLLEEIAKFYGRNKIKTFNVKYSEILDNIFNNKSVSGHANTWKNTDADLLNKVSDNYYNSSRDTSSNTDTSNNNNNKNADINSGTNNKNNTRTESGTNKNDAKENKTNFNLEFLNQEEAEKIANTLKELISQNKEKEAKTFLEHLNLNVLDKTIMENIAKEFAGMRKSNTSEEATVLDNLNTHIVDQQTMKDIKAMFEDLMTDKKENNDVDTEKQKLDLTGKLLEPDQELKDTLKELFDKVDKREKEKEFLESLNVNVLNKEIVNDIANILNDMKKENAKAEESESIYRNIANSLNVNSDDVKEMAKAIKDIETEAKEREFLENLDLNTINKEVANDVAEMLKDMKNSGEKETYSTRAEKFNHEQGINFNILREKFLEKINKERTAHGLNPLVLNERLEKGTAIRSQELADNGHIRTGENKDQKHKRLDGKSSFRTAFDYMPNYEEDKAQYLGENLAGIWIPEGENVTFEGDSADKTVFDEEIVANKFFQMWKESPGHYKNFMHKDYKTMWFEARLGKAKALDQDSGYKYEFLAGTQILSLKDEEAFKRDQEIADMHADKVDGEVAVGEDNTTEKAEVEVSVEEAVAYNIEKEGLDAKKDSVSETDISAEDNMATEDSGSSKEKVPDNSTNTESANAQSDGNSDIASPEYTDAE